MTSSFPTLARTNKRFHAADIRFAPRCQRLSLELQRLYRFVNRAKRLVNLGYLREFF